MFLFVRVLAEILAAELANVGSHLQVDRLDVDFEVLWVGVGFLAEPALRLQLNWWRGRALKDLNYTLTNWWRGRVMHFNA